MLSRSSELAQTEMYKFFKKYTVIGAINEYIARGNN